MTAPWALLLGAVTLLATAEGVVLYFVVRALARLIKFAEGTESITLPGIAGQLQRIDALNSRLIEIEHGGRAADGTTLETALKRCEGLADLAADERARIAGIQARLKKAEDALEKLTLGNAFKGGG